MQSFQFPIKGIDRTVLRSAQPVGTAVDMLNVFAYDGAGRARGGQRPGTVKLQDDSLAGGINLLAQNTTILDPADFDPLIDNIFEQFTYSDGDLDDVSGGNWDMWRGYDPTFPSPPGDVLSVVSGEVNADAAASIVFGRYVGSATVSDDYTMSMTITVDAEAQVIFYLIANLPSSAPSSITDTAYVSLNVVGSGGSVSQAILSINVDGVEVASTDLAADGSAPAAGVPFQLYLKREGQKFTAWASTSDSRLTVVASGLNDGPKVGFGIDPAGNSSVYSVDDFTVTNAQPVGARAAYRGTVLIAASQGNVYTGDLTSVTLATGGTAVLDPDAQPQVAFFGGKAYFVDGISDLKQMDVPTATFETFTFTGGVETVTTLGAYRLIATWHGRLVLASSLAFPQNFIMSRVGDPHDFDIADTDPGAAFVGNDSTAGQIGEPITALIPMSDDILVMGGDHTMWAVRGDPAAGGSIDLVSDAIGVLGPNAWAKAPDGSVYFVGPGAFFRMAGNAGLPVDISSTKYPQFFKNLNRATNYISCAWDRDNHGCYIFVAPVDGTQGTSLWYDARTDGFFPIQYPASHGPIVSLVYDGDDVDDRVLILGSNDGYLRITDSTALTDDGTTISTFVFIGPFQVGKGLMTDGIINGLDITWGEPQEGIATSFLRTDVAVYTARDAYSVTQGTPQHVFSRTYSSLPGRVTSIRPRLRGAWGMIKLSNSTNNTTWSFETVTYDAQVVGGKTRR